MSTVMRLGSERSVSVPTFSESSRRPPASAQRSAETPDPSDGTQRGHWRTNGGPHGELQYEPNADDGDAT